MQVVSKITTELAFKILIYTEIYEKCFLLLFRSILSNGMIEIRS